MPIPLIAAAGSMIMGAASKAGGALGGGGGGVAKGAGEVAAKANKLGLRSLEKEKQGENKERLDKKKTLSSITGIHMSTSSALRQSQLFTGVVGAFFQMIGAMVDVMLMPLVPLVMPLLSFMGTRIGQMMKVSQFMTAVMTPIGIWLEMSLNFWKNPVSLWSLVTGDWPEAWTDGFTKLKDHFQSDQSAGALIKKWIKEGTDTIKDKGATPAIIQKKEKEQAEAAKEALKIGGTFPEEVVKKAEETKTESTNLILGLGGNMADAIDQAIADAETAAGKSGNPMKEVANNISDWIMSEDNGGGKWMVNKVKGIKNWLFGGGGSDLSATLREEWSTRAVTSGPGRSSNDLTSAAMADAGIPTTNLYAHTSFVNTGWGENPQAFSMNKDKVLTNLTHIQTGEFNKVDLYDGNTK